LNGAIAISTTLTPSANGFTVTNPQAKGHLRLRQLPYSML